ncbi:MAG: hypothetical protein ACR2JR_05800 [Rubrobacteraceae bacterium]
MPDEAIETFVEHAHRVTSPLTSVLLVPMGDEMGSRAQGGDGTVDW